jgi:signal transduction histidine kinase
LRGYGLTLPNGLGLLVARDLYPQDQVSDLMERTFSIGVLLTLVAALGSGAIVSRRILRRIEEIGRTSREIMSGDLGRRIPLDAGDRAFDGLALSLNEMLGRIEELMDGVRQVTDNIAHDMRTPLTRLRQHLEQVRTAGHSVEEFQNAVDVALLETDGLLETFGALLRIAQIEARPPGSGLQPVVLSELCAMIAETYAPVAEAEGHRLLAAVVPNLTIAGDRQLLTQMLVNLVENALQHNVPGTEIRLLLQAGASGPLLSVTDDGIGIPLEERENVLKRFYRVDAARSSQGSGLGLSLVAAIARYHGATLALDDNGPGLAVRLAFVSPPAARLPA